jgi:hypothetical protein
MILVSIYGHYVSLDLKFLEPMMDRGTIIAFVGSNTSVI